MKKCLEPSKATEKIRELGKDDHSDWWITRHFKDRMEERHLINSDVKHLLRTGFVYEEGEPSTVRGLWKYRVTGKTPNSNNRSVVIVVIPDFSDRSLKFVTIFWRDADQ